MPVPIAMRCPVHLSRASPAVVSFNRMTSRLLRVRCRATDGNERRGEEGAPNSPSSGGAAEDTVWRGDLTFDEVKEKYLRPVYLPGSFVLGTLTFGLKTAADNFVFAEDPLSFIGCAVISGFITCAIAWVLFDFVDTPPSSGNFSSPE